MKPTPNWIRARNEFATIIDADTGKQVADFGSPYIGEEEAMRNLAIGLAAPKLLAFVEQIARIVGSANRVE